MRSVTGSGISTDGRGPVALNAQDVRYEIWFRIGIEVRLTHAALIARKANIAMCYNDPTKCLNWPGGAGWCTWFKNQLREYGYLKGLGQPVDNLCVKTILHVFVDKVLEDDGVTRFDYDGEFTRSKIFIGHEIPHPIDLVAHRVAPEKENQ